MSTSGGRGRNKGVNSGRSPAPSKAKVSRERGIPPDSKNQGGSVQSLTAASNGDNDIKTWLNELKQQIEKDVYNEKAFDKKPNGDSESGKLSVIFKEICKNIKSRSEYQRGLLSNIETLYSKLQKACDDLKVDASGAASPLEVHGAAARKKESPGERELSTAIVNAEKLIEKVSSKRDTKGINKKVDNKKQEQQAHEAVKKAEQQWKSKLNDVKDWLNKLLQQISDNKYDEKVFLKPKTIEGSHEELNKCHNTILDCCKKLKNENDSKTGANKEITLLLKEIKEWNDVKTINEAKEDCKDTDVKAFRGGRLQVHKWKKEFKSAKQEVDCLTKELKSWAEVKAIDGEIDSDCELARLIRSNRSTILEKKKELQSEKEKKEDTRKLTKNQEQAIKDILTIIHKDKNSSGKVDIANYLDKIKQHVSVTRENLDEIETEVNSLLEEINAWDVTTPLKEAKGIACKEVKALRESRSKLRKRKLDFKSEHDKEDVAQKEKYSQDQVIKEMWTMIRPTSGRVNSGGDEIGKALKEIKKYMSDAQRRQAEFNDIETEINSLLEEINAWDDTKPLNKANGNACKVVEDLRDSRLKLRQRKLDLKSEHDKEDVAQIEKYSQDQVIKQIWTMIRPTSDKVNSKGNEIGTALEEIKIYVSDAQKRLAEFNKVEGLVSQVEGKGNKIFSELNGGNHSKIDDPNTLVHSLKSTLGVMESCENETNAFIEIVTMLEGDLNIDRKSDSVSNRCKVIKKTVETYVRREDYDNLQDKMRNLRVENEQLREEKDSAYNRLSKVAGARLTDNNPNIADLSDPNRPTKIAEQYSELYDTPWTDAYEILKDKDQENTDFLLKIIVDCYEICGKISMNHQRNLKNAVCYPANNIKDGQASEQKKGKTENPVSFSAVQSKALSELRKQTADISVVNVISQIESTQKGWFVPEKLRSYTTRCIELCWLMHVQTPPVVIDRSPKPGSKFDTNKYKQYTKAGKKIDFIVWPVLLLEEGGAILCKGVAQGKQ